MRLGNILLPNWSVHFKGVHISEITLIMIILVCILLVVYHTIQTCTDNMLVEQGIYTKLAHNEPLDSQEKEFLDEICNGGWTVKDGTVVCNTGGRTPPSSCGCR